MEDLIKSHPDVADVGVIGVPQPPDDLPKAFVVKKQGSTVTEQDIISFVQGIAAVHTVVSKQTSNFYCVGISDIMSKC